MRLKKTYSTLFSLLLVTAGGLFLLHHLMTPFGSSTSPESHGNPAAVAPAQAVHQMAIRSVESTAGSGAMPAPALDAVPVSDGIHWRIPSTADGQNYVVALDELYLPEKGKESSIHRLEPPAADLPELLSAASRLAEGNKRRPLLVVYPAEAPGVAGLRRLVTMQVHVKASDFSVLEAVAVNYGLGALKRLSYSPGSALVSVSGDPAQPLRAAAALASIPGVSFASPMLSSNVVPLARPNDQLFSRQWHIQNTGQQNGIAGKDINVLPVWDEGIDGLEVRIGILDDGMDRWHTDLKPNLAARHKDWVAPLEEASENYDDQVDAHGTAVAGLAAAVGNNHIGGIGAAPKAQLSRLRILGHDEVTDASIAEALLWEYEDEEAQQDDEGNAIPPPFSTIHIKNNSWGGTSVYYPYYWEPLSTRSLLFDALAEGTTNGRHGLGTIYVFASGNAQKYNPGVKNFISATPCVIPVGASTHRGDVADFSQGGPHLVVSAPGDASEGLTTTGRYNTYMSTFNGTSASAPLVSGVIALMLDTNPELGWRDVKEILLRSSTQSGGSSWTSRDGGQPSLPRIKHDHMMGGGMVNAAEAVALARRWQSLHETGTVTVETIASYPIPDATAGFTHPLLDEPALVEDGELICKVNFPRNYENLRLEHIEARVEISHAYRGSIDVRLRSPAGVTSTLLPSNSKDTGSGVSWNFVTVRHWGESSQGTWSLVIRDKKADNIKGTLASAKLTFRGTKISKPKMVTEPEPLVIRKVGQSVTVSTTVSGPSLDYQWRCNNRDIVNANEHTLSLTDLSIDQAGAYACTIVNLGGSVSTAVADLTVYEERSQTLPAVYEGATLRIPAVVGGAGLKGLQWYRDGQSLANDSRVSGANSPSLVIKNASPFDAGAYTLRVVAANGQELPVGAVNVQVTGIQPGELLYGEIGQGLSLPLPAGGVKYSFKGLPKGIKFNAKTGQFTGVATTAGTYIVTLTTTYADKTRDTSRFNIQITVSPWIGAFNGYAARHAAVNQNAGALLSYNVATSGAISGRLTVGTAAASFRSKLQFPSDGVGAASFVATVSPKGNPPLALTVLMPRDGLPVTGTLRRAAGGNAVADIVAWQKPWDKKKQPATFYSGAYTLSMNVTEASLGGVEYPAGPASLALTVGLDGGVRWTMSPSDGSPAIKGTTALSGTGELPLYAVQRKMAGSVVGGLCLPERLAPVADITGDVTWWRAASSEYACPAGFGPVPFTLLGHPYDPPAKGQLLFGLKSEDGNMRLKFDTGEGTGLDDSDPERFDMFFGLLNGNKVRSPLLPDKPKLKITPATGEFSGTLQLSDPDLRNPKKTVRRTVKFSGVVLQDFGRGLGSFVVPALPGAKTPMAGTGSLVLGPSDDFWNTEDPQ